MISSSSSIRKTALSASSTPGICDQIIHPYIQAQCTKTASLADEGNSAYFQSSGAHNIKRGIELGI